MFRPIGQHLLARGRLPPEEGRLVEADQGAVAMRTHVDILHAGIGKELTETPADTVHIVLHGQLCTHT